jgi:SAP domain
MPARDTSRWTQTERGTWRYTPNKVVEAEDSSDEGYEGMTKAELEDELASRDLPKSGTKAELIARLTEDDAA